MIHLLMIRADRRGGRDLTDFDTDGNRTAWPISSHALLCLQPPRAARVGHPPQSVREDNRRWSVA